MKNLPKRTNKGFTIIEVMIVLAIAGLIMVIVFIAVPQLQRNQRDNARQSIANRLKAEMETYAGNNQGQYPFTVAACGSAPDTGKWCDFYNRYISGKVNVKDPNTGNDVVAAAPGVLGAAPDTTTFVIGAGAATALPTQRGDVTVAYGAKCKGESLAASGGASVNTRNYALLIGLDRAGTMYCADNG
jgi:prepilin-type N-terminal cleavage/methylation domain-containing protein